MRRGLVVLLCAALAGCGMKTSGQPSSSDAATIDLINYPATLDPGRQYDTDSYSVYRNIFDQLLRRDARTNAVKPWLATSWRQVDGTTWTFTIRPGVTFSDGAPLTAADAAYSIERILDKKFASQQFANFSAISEASASGNTLTIRTKVPSPTLLSYLTTLSVVPKDYVERVGAQRFNEHPVGSGAYTLASSTAGSQVTLKANPRWWGPRPAIRTVTLRSVPNVASRVADLRAGKADLVTGLTPDTADQVKRDPNLRVLSTPTERVAYVAFNTIHGGPVNDPRVRQAIAAAIDYKAIITSLQRGYARPVNALLTPLANGYPTDLTGAGSDLAKARTLLQQAGAQGATLVMATSPSFNPQIVQAIQGNLAAVGLKVKIENTDQPTYLKKVQDPGHEWGSLRFGRWSCSCLDADGVIYPLFHSGTIWSSYANPRFDRLADQGRTTMDAAARTKIYRSAFQILAEDVPGIGLYQDFAIYGAAKGLRWRPDAQEDFYVADMALGR
jgi:peptide/nickel transport system substrate-binding protein